MCFMIPVEAEQQKLHYVLMCDIIKAIPHNPLCVRCKVSFFVRVCVL